MRREGYRPSTIRAAVSALKAIARKANLLNPEAVKTHLASRKVSLGRKVKICEDLARFYKFKQIPFQMPRYRRIDTIPFVPQEKEVDQLISGCGKKTAAFLQLCSLNESLRLRRSRASHSQTSRSQPKNRNHNQQGLDDQGRIDSVDYVRIFTQFSPPDFDVAFQPRPVHSSTKPPGIA